jgi:hypothetical protein
LWEALLGRLGLCRGFCWFSEDFCKAYLSVRGGELIYPTPLLPGYALPPESGYSHSQSQLG